MRNRKLNNTKKDLMKDLKNNPAVLSAPLENEETHRKILTYINMCAHSNISKDECVDWLCQLYCNQNDAEKQTFQSVIDSIAVAFYTFYERLNQESEK